MKEHIAERVREVGAYIATYHSTIRQTAVVFKCCKSTVHKDCIDRLPRLNPLLAGKVRRIFDYNKRVRTIRGGESTRKKYLEIRTTSLN